jgi:hypothetical protein
MGGSSGQGRVAAADAAAAAAADPAVLLGGQAGTSGCVSGSSSNSQVPASPWRVTFTPLSAARKAVLPEPALLLPCLLHPFAATAGSARMFNWLDYDGSSTQRTGPTIVGSFPSWWHLAPDCSYEARGGRAWLGVGGWGWREAANWGRAEGEQQASGRLKRCLLTVSP